MGEVFDGGRTKFINKCRGGVLPSVCREDPYGHPINESRIPMKKGYVHIYVGENSDKLPTSLGMALRACGAGLKLGYFSFGHIANMSDLAVRMPQAHFRMLEEDPADLAAIAQNASQFDMIILNGCCAIDGDILADFIKNKPSHIEFVLQGKGFSQNILDMADLISEVANL